MSKPQKPYKPGRRHIEDYRLFEINVCVEENDGCDNCPETQTCDRRYYYIDLSRVSLANLIEAYKDYNPNDILIGAIDTGDHYSSLEILRPETDEEFAVKVKAYEVAVEEYNKWLENNTPEKKQQRKEEKKLAKLTKLKEEAKKLEKEISPQLKEDLKEIKKQVAKW